MPSACPEQPDLNGGSTHPDAPFFDCGLGPEDWSAPSPTTYPHAFGDVGSTGFDHSVICFKPFSWATWWDYAQFDLPNITIRESDRVIYNEAIFPGDVVFTGQRVQFNNAVGFGAATGEYVCAPGADQIEVDGDCLCPVPEPSLMAGLLIGLVALVALKGHRRR